MTYRFSVLKLPRLPSADRRTFRQSAVFCKMVRCLGGWCGYQYDVCAERDVGSCDEDRWLVPVHLLISLSWEFGMRDAVLLPNGQIAIDPADERV